MSSTVTAAPKKRADIQALRCLNEECGGLLAYEVDGSNALYVDLSWTARRDGPIKYFPCPKCGGRNLVEPSQNDKGENVQRVTRFQR